MSDRWKKTKLMRAAEAAVGMPVDDYIRQRLNGGLVYDGTFEDLAVELDISTSVLNYWMLKFGISTRCVAVAPGHRVYAIDRDGSERLVLEV